MLIKHVIKGHFYNFAENYAKYEDIRLVKIK